ncbi:MAG: ATP-binding protein [Marinifilaceae bacterium]
MKEIVILSGKGGTGKTSIAASFAYLAKNDLVLADCDVDAANMHIILDADFGQSTDFYSGKLAVVDSDKCIECGKCLEACHFNAISQNFTVNPLDCEGCGYCQKVCPSDAISFKDCLTGQWFLSKTRMNSDLIHARLSIGADNSGKLVALVKKEARKQAEKNNASYILVDGSPGIACPVISSLSGADFVVLVTEASLSGFSDLKRVYELVRSFKIKAACIINKVDINLEVAEEIRLFLDQQGIEHLASLPYDESFSKAMKINKTVLEYDNSDLKKKIEYSWNKIKTLIK